MIQEVKRWSCVCQHCGKPWISRSDDIPKICPNPKCHRTTWNGDYDPNKIYIKIPFTAPDQIGWKQAGRIIKPVKAGTRDKNWATCPYGSDADDCECGGEASKRKMR